MVSLAIVILKHLESPIIIIYTLKERKRTILIYVINCYTNITVIINVCICAEYEECSVLHDLCSMRDDDFCKCLTKHN